MKIKPVMSQSYFPRMPCLIRSCNDVSSALGWKICLPPPKVSTEFVSPGRTEKQKNICWPQSVNYMNAQIVLEVYLDMEILLERKIGSYDCCILSVLSTDHHSCIERKIGSYDCCILSVLSTDHHSCSIGSTNLLSSPFDYCVKSEFQFWRPSSLGREIKSSWLIFSFKS